MRKKKESRGVSLGLGERVRPQEKIRDEYASVLSLYTAELPDRVRCGVLISRLGTNAINLA